MLILSLILIAISVITLGFTLPKYLRDKVYPSIAWRSSEDILPLQAIDDKFLILENSSKIFGFELLGYDTQTIAEDEEKSRIILSIGH